MTHIRELWIDGFGCLRTTAEPYRFERGRINLLLDRNEAGKTTLQMALLAAFYGIETHKAKRRSRNSLRPHHDDWLPLAGPPFGLRLRLHDGRRLLEVRWSFAADSAFHVVDLDTNQDVTQKVCPGSDPLELGRRLLGLTIEEFAKTCLVRQDDLPYVRDVDGLDALVQRAADTQAGSSTVAGAQDHLRDMLRSYPGVTLKESGRIETEISRLQEEIHVLENRLAELEAERAAVAAEDAEFQRLAAERDDLRRQAVRLEYLAQVAEYDELRRQVDDAEKHQAAFDQLEAECKSLAWLEGFPADQADMLMQWQIARLGLLHNAEQAERVIADLRANAYEPAQSELEGLRRLATVSHDDLDALTELLGKTRDFEARERKLLAAIAREEAQAASQGASVNELDRLEERFARLEPGDGQFLTDHERTAAQIASELEEVKLRALEATLRIDRVTEDRARQRDAGRRTVVAGAIVAAAGAVAGTLIALAHLPLGISLGAVALAVAAWLVLTGRKAAAAAESLGHDDLAHARLELGQVEARREQLAADQRQRAARLGQLAARFGYEQPDVLVEDRASLDDLRRLCGNLIVLRGQEDDIAAQRLEIEAEVAARLKALDVPPPVGTTLSAALDDLQKRMGRSLRLRKQLEDLSQRINGETQRRDELRQEAERLTARIRALLATAGLGDARAIEGAINTFHTHGQQYQRFRQLTDELVPRAAAALVNPKTVDALRADAERLHRTIATQREERPSLVSLQAAERATEYRRQRADVSGRLDKVSKEAQAAGQHVVGVLARCHSEQPRVEEALAERGRHLARAQRHAAALQMAIEVLDEIGREVHGRWAEELNHATSAFLHRVAPTLSDLKFDSRLCFGVSHRARNGGGEVAAASARPWPPGHSHSAGELPVRSNEPDGRGPSNPSPILSAGTWDQLYLAVRLGIADFVARRGNGSLLLLDDPFAHFDDERFEAAMRLLAELAQGHHQVVLFSCQCQRFEWLKSRDPQWFAANILPSSVRAGEPSSA